MGLVIGFGYLFAFAILLGVFKYASKRIEIHENRSHWICEKYRYFMPILMIIAVAILLAVMSWIKHVSNSGFEALIYQISISLVGPFVLSWLSHGVATTIVKGSGASCLSTVLQAFSLASLHAFWVFPALGLAYIVIFEL